MSYDVIPTPVFKTQSKRLIKKYPSLKLELLDLSNLLMRTPDAGTALGNNTFKIRLAIRSKGKGKSGGARVITYKVDRNKEVYLLTIYDKSEVESIDDRSVSTIIKQIKFK